MRGIWYQRLVGPKKFFFSLLMLGAFALSGLQARFESITHLQTAELACQDAAGCLDEDHGADPHDEDRKADHAHVHVHACTSCVLPIRQIALRSFEPATSALKAATDWSVPGSPHLASLFRPPRA